MIFLAILVSDGYFVPAYSNPSSATVTVWVRAVPFAYQPGARLQAETWIRSDSAFGPEHLRESLQLAPRRFAEPAMLDFLEPVAELLGSKGHD